jgi:hypothetical protein
MPKIIINEYDNTKPGQTAYANFAVVVPGFVGADKTKNQIKEIFDENGVYECNSQTEFKDKIGKVSAELTIKTDLRPVNCSQIYYYAPCMGIEEAYRMAADEVPQAFSDTFTTSNILTDLSIEEEFNKIKDPFDRQALYIATVNVDSEGKLIKPVAPNSADESYYYTKVEKLYSAVTEVMTEETGTEEEENVAKFELLLEPHTFYCVITESDMIDANKYNSKTVMHYGNQIAWELLGMGYTVLYKYLDRDLLALENSEAAATSGTESATAENNTANIKFIKELENYDFWSCLTDRATYDFRYILSGLLEYNSLVNTQMEKLAHRHNKSFDDISENGRGDCIALLDIDRNKYAGKTQAEAIPLIAQEGNKYTSQYAATFAPTVTYDMALDPAFGKNCTFPGSFHYLACAAKASENYNEWYANAGYTRGVCKYNIASTGCKFGEMAIQALEPRSTNTPFSYKDTAGKSKTQNVTSAVNLIVKIKNSYYLWGNRTAYTLTAKDLVASHFLNVRQLCTTIKKQVYTACRQFTYEPNSDLLWIKFCGALEPMLEKMKADQGIKNYEILQIKHDRKAMLQARLRIVPIEAVEDFYINMMLVDSISGVDVEAVE